MKVHEHIFEQIFSPENLFLAWEEFRKGKSARKDVQVFEWKLEEHIFQLHRELADGSYQHGHYSAFHICDPKQRLIHKATVRDRIVHHAVFAALNSIFEPTFIAHSFSCRRGKGTHRGVDALETMLRKVSKNHTKPCFTLKCDIHRFFASVDHAVLLRMLGERIRDDRVMELLEEIIRSFSDGKGIPIGNLTSQLFANVYMNALDQFIKHELRLKHYVRYTDDFIILAASVDALHDVLPSVQLFLSEKLHLELHPHKVSIRKYRQGIDFLGYVLLPHYRALRTKTKRRILRKLHAKAQASGYDPSQEQSLNQSLQSYLGVLSHADTFRFNQELQNQCWFWQTESELFCCVKEHMRYTSLHGQEEASPATDGNTHCSL